MISVSHALDILKENSFKPETERVSIENAMGRILSEDLCADRDFPPFDRVTMDGIAIQYQKYTDGLRVFPIEQTAPAGVSQQILQNTSACIEVMTGAMLPRNTDTVIRYEDVEIKDRQASIIANQVSFKQNIHFKGMDRKKGDMIVSKNTLISDTEINIAASAGKQHLSVLSRPSVAVISTGNELVDIDQVPAVHQIRRSNVYGIQAALKKWGLQSTLFHMSDDKNALNKAVSDVLEQFDILIFTGGVSKGKYDHLPDVFEKLGVKKMFHKIKQRPGKPFWFGTKGEKKIFAFPGNPVSSFVCLYVYFRTWYFHSLNIPIRPLYAVLDNEVYFEPGLTYFVEAKFVHSGDGKIMATTVLGNGSGDFANLVDADGFLMLPPEKSVFKKGEVYPFIQYRNIV